MNAEIPAVMIRARFEITAEDGDYRPVRWPIKHPYWCTGQRHPCHYYIVAYADDVAEILSNWPDAEKIVHVAASEYAFTDRFPRPEWFDGSAN